MGSGTRPASLLAGESIPRPEGKRRHALINLQTHHSLPSFQSDGSSTVVNRWELIETALLGREISNSKELELAICSYNSKYAKSWTFRGLHMFFEDELDEPEANLFFTGILPKIIRLALQLPTLIPCSIPLLKHGHNLSLSMTQQQIACLMANAFLCTFPRRNTQKMNSEYKHFPDINFNRLFQSTQATAMEKLKCVCHYFRRVTTSTPIGVVTFRRRSLPPKCIPKFSETTTEIKRCHLVVRSSGTIEADGKGLLQVDFANKMIGGGVLGQGCVQEEIRFVICPELLITRLFTEVLRPEEALFVIGAEQFSLYTGYASTFEWAGNCDDTTPLDGNQRRQCQIVAIDALPFQNPKHQYRPELMLRELTKAYVGYARLQQQLQVAPGVASGNWGCGAFNGDAHLKSLLQLMICAIAERPLVYFTFGDRQLVEELEEMYRVLCEKQVTVAGLWKVLLKFSEEKRRGGVELFEFIKKEMQKKKHTLTSLFSFDAKSVPKLTAPKEGEELLTGFQKSGAARASKVASNVGTIAAAEGEDGEGPKASVRDYSDTDDEMPRDQAEQQQQNKKNKLTSPEVNGGGREKMARMSLADCLDSYFTKDSGKKVAPSGSSYRGITEIDGVCGSSSSSSVAVIGEVVQEAVIEDSGGGGRIVKTKNEDERLKLEPPKLDVIVQIDENGEEYIDASPPEPPPRDSQYAGRQTKLMDFFKMRNAKK